MNDITWKSHAASYSGAYVANQDERDPYVVIRRVMVTGSDKGFVRLELFQSCPDEALRREIDLSFVSFEALNDFVEMINQAVYRAEEEK